MRLITVALLLAALYGAYDYFSMRPIGHPPGILVAEIPSQENLADAAPLDHGAFRLTPRADFTAEVRVLARERYRLGTLADASPLDLAVGWGPMSDSAVLAELDVSQGNRFYYWHFDDEPPIPRKEIETNSANWHLVPDTQAVWKTLRGVRVGDVVTLEGELVDIAGPDGGTIRTSLRRDDTGAGACEVLLVRAISVRAR